jgi:formate hydrogenlyase subunit 3/multisubunit Na+/H+ antiporter MnhD subunit
MRLSVEIVPALIFAPVIAGCVCLLLSDRLKRASQALALAVSAAAFALSIAVFAERPVSWSLGPHSLFYVDTLSAFIGMGVALFAVLVTVYSFGYIERDFGRYFGYCLITLGSSVGVAYADNLIALIVFWGVLAAMLYLLVNMQGTPGSGNAAKKALIIIGGTDALALFGLALMWAITQTFSIGATHIRLDSVWAYLAYLTVAMAGLAKAGAMPFHSWLPDVAESSQAPVTAYLPASLDKLLGIYLLTRASLDLFVMNGATNLMLATVGSVTIVLAVIFALVQHDLKRLLGYHAVSQVGYMVLGIGTGVPIGIAGGLFHMLNHAIYKSCLFLTGGSVEKKAKTTDLAKLGGLAGRMKVTFACFLVASLSISGIPPFNGFVSKWMIYQGIIESGSPKNAFWIIWLTAAMFGSALTVASFMKLLHAVFLGRPERDFGSIKGAGICMSLPAVVLAALCVGLGVFAFGFPLKMLILPALGIPISYLGTWSPVVATSLLVAGIIAGLAGYLLIRTARFRSVQTFVGGEDPETLGRVTGTEFYETVQEMKAFRALYGRESSGELDIYTVGGRVMMSAAKFLRYLHNGILPTYMVWCLLGMAGLFIFLFFR